MPGKNILALICVVILSSLPACTSLIPPASLQEPTPGPTSTPVDSPPPASLAIGSAIQSAGLGSYCWNYETADGGVGACIDKVGLPTPRDPLVSRSPVTAQLTLPLPDEPPEHLQLSIFEALEKYEVKMDDLPAMFRYWMPSEGAPVDLALKPSQVISMDLEPGLYVFNVFVSWKNRGDASYGFLVEVR